MMIYRNQPGLGRRSLRIGGNTRESNNIIHLRIVLIGTFFLIVLRLSMKEEVRSHHKSWWWWKNLTAQQSSRVMGAGVLNRSSRTKEENRNLIRIQCCAKTTWYQWLFVGVCDANNRRNHERSDAFRATTVVVKSYATLAVKPDWTSSILFLHNNR